MDTKLTPESLLQQISQIPRLERGTLVLRVKGLRDLIITTNVMKTAATSPVTSPPNRCQNYRKAIEGYHQVQALMAQYLQLLVERTRSERAADAKKRADTTTPPGSGTRNPATDRPL